MKKILIDKQIGDSWFDSGISAAGIREELEGFNEPDNCLEFVIDSPGGSVWEGISIFNIIREFCRDNPKVVVKSYIQGMAASMASVIALAAKSVNSNNKVICEDNSVFMIHNAWTYAGGNHLDLEKEAANLSAIDGLLRNVYMKVTGMNEKMVTKLMDEETWFYGNDIVNRGFADEVIEATGGDSDENKNLLSAKADFVHAMDGLKASNERMSYQECASILEHDFSLVGSRNACVPEKNIVDVSTVEDGRMTVDELKASNPEVFNQIFLKGKEAGVSEERARVDAHLHMGEVAGCLDVAAGFIRDGSAVADNAVQTTYFEKRVSNAENAKRVEDNVKNVELPVASSGNENVDLFMKGFDQAVGLGE